MKSISLAVAAAAIVAGGAFVDAASARDREVRAERNPLTASQIVAREDARTARIKADLRLTPEQERNWPGFETALHDIGMTRADRQVAFRADREQRKEPGDIIQHLNERARFLADRSADIKKLADAAQPLHASLDDRQKRRLANELMGLSRGRSSED